MSAFSNGEPSNPPTTPTADGGAWPAVEPLGPLARRRRDEMLGVLHGELAARRRRRVAVRVGLAAVVVLAGAGVVRVLTAPAAATPRPEVAQAPAVPQVMPLAQPVVAAGPRIVTVSNDPGVLARYAAPAPSGLIRVVDDAGALSLLERAGAPGLIQVDGRVILSRDLSPRDPSLEPQSGAPGGKDRGRA